MTVIVSKSKPILLVGGGQVDPGDFALVRAMCDQIVAADSGADSLLALGATPDWVIGDFDSATPQALAAIPPARRLLVAEQETTDFEKALTRIDAPAILCLGFTGERIDHELAVYATLVRHPGKRAIVIGAVDICLHVRRTALTLPPDSRVSLFPMAPVSGLSEGLFWPIEGLSFAPQSRIGTSNRVTGPLRLDFDADGMLLILPKAALPEVLASAPPPLPRSG